MEGGGGVNWRGVQGGGWQPRALMTELSRGHPEASKNRALG